MGILLLPPDLDSDKQPYAYDAFNGANGDFAALAADGAVCAIRYICGGRAPAKELHPGEVDALHAAGIGVIAVWEWAANDALRGYGVGKQYGEEAVTQLRALGYPLGQVPVFWCADSSTSNVRANFQDVEDYAVGWRDAFSERDIDPATLGCYGGQQLIQYLMQRGKITYGWRAGAASWSQFAPISDDMHIVQRVGSPFVGGITIDVNHILRPVPAWIAGPDQFEPASEDTKVITVVRETGYDASFASDGMALRWLPDQAAYDHATGGKGDAAVTFINPGTLAAWGALIGPVPPDGSFGTPLDKLRAPADDSHALIGNATVSVQLHPM